MLRSIKLAGLALAIAMGGSGLALAQDGYRYYDRDDHYGYNNHYGYNDSGLRIARSTGYDDGSRVAYHDLTHRNPFNPYPARQVLAPGPRLSSRVRRQVRLQGGI
jgi:hypothetical protein